MSKYCDLTELSAIKNIASRYEKLPIFLQELICRSVHEINPLRVYAFGSRVRGDFCETSDIDLAFELESPSNWSSFSLDEPERIRTLLSVDLVNLSDAGKELKNYILSKGIVIYDRSIKI